MASIKVIAVAGVGNMGGAIAKRLAKAYPTLELLIYDTDPVRMNSLADSMENISAAETPSALGNDADMIIVAVKPQCIDEVIPEAIAGCRKNVLLLSIAAGVELMRLAHASEGKGRWIRCMPNTPALIGEGMVALSPSEQVSSSEVHHIKELFGAFGEVEILPESQMDIFTALAGSSPAFTAIYIEALADAAVREGMARETAYKTACQAVAGTALLMRKESLHPGLLKDQVTSPAGTTIEGVCALERGGFRNAAIDAIAATTQRSRELKD